MLMKIDLRKAYDSIEWKFMEEIFVGLDFFDHFTKCIMECITTPRFTLMVNGSTEGLFRAKRGLR